MSILHHPSEEFLAAFAAGTLDQGQHVAMATHLMTCSECRKWVHDMEHVGGTVLDGISPETMSGGALDRLLSRLDEPAHVAQPAPKSHDGLSDVAGLPAFVRRFPTGQWKWLAPRLHLRRISLSDCDETRVFLLRAGPNLKLLPHAHTGTEMTCILQGSFSHDGSRYGAGDFDLGDDNMIHEISTGPECECVCLVAMQGELKLQGLVGRLVQPFTAL
jgi:putative transcriptional regulator